MIHSEGTIRIHKFVGVGIIELQKVLELVSFLLETQADTMLHFRECCSQLDTMDCCNCRNQEDWAAKYSMLPNFCVIGKFLRDFLIINPGHSPSESLCMFHDK